MTAVQFVHWLKGYLDASVAPLSQQDLDALKLRLSRVDVLRAREWEQMGTVARAANEGLPSSLALPRRSDGHEQRNDAGPRLLPRTGG